MCTGVEGVSGVERFSGVEEFSPELTKHMEGEEKLTGTLNPEVS